MSSLISEINQNIVKTGKNIQIQGRDNSSYLNPQITFYHDPWPPYVPQI